jgi:hypothetical protein
VPSTLNRILFLQAQTFEARFGMDRHLVRCFAMVADCIHQRIRLQERTGSWLGAPLGSHCASERRDLDLRTRSLTSELDDWYMGTSLVDKESRTRIGSMTLWHACRILVHHDIEQASPMDETVRADASAVIDLCMESGDKVECLNWVSTSAN